MSNTATIADFILALTAGLPSAPFTTRNAITAGFKRPSQFSPDDLPAAQIFGASYTSELIEIGQSSETLTFALWFIYDEDQGEAAWLDVEALVETLQDNYNLNPLDRLHLSDYLVDETGKDRRTLAVMEVTGLVTEDPD